VKKLFAAVAFAGLLLCEACSPTVKVKHQVEPIFITVEVNIRVQKELEDFFDFEKKIENQNQQ